MSFGSPSNSKDNPTVNLAEKRSRLREEKNENKVLADLLQTPPNKRVKTHDADTSATSPIKVIKGWFTTAMSWTSKYNIWNYVVGKPTNREKPKTIVQIDLEDKPHDVQETRAKPSEVIYIGTTFADASSNQRPRQRVGHVQVEKTSSSKGVSTVEPVLKRHTLHPSSSREDKSTASSSTTLHAQDGQRARRPVIIIPDVPSHDQQKQHYARTGHEEVKENKSDIPVYRKAPRLLLTQQQQSTLLSENKTFQNSYNITQPSFESRVPGKIRVRPSKESVRKTFITRKRSTANEVVRLEEKKRYMQLLSQFTTSVKPDNPSTAHSDKDISHYDATYQSGVSECTIITPKSPSSYRKPRLADRSVLSPRSSLLPSHHVVHHIDSLSSVSRPTVLKVMPSTARVPSKTEHIEDLTLYSKPDSAGFPRQTIPSTRSPQPMKKEDPILGETWTKKWRDILSPDNLLREREKSRIAREEQRLKVFKTKRFEEQRSAIEEVKERIRIEEESEEIEEEEEFITLSEEIERTIDSALGPGNPGQVLVGGFKISVTRGDMATLSNLNWLNDEIINFYVTLVTERSKFQGYPKVHSFNSFFYPKLIKSGYDSLKRWTRKVDVFAVDIIVVPIHLGMHWCLAAIDFRSKTIKYYDSLKTSNPQCLNALKSYLSQESMNKKKVPYDTSDWTLSSPKDIPEQLNGCDCGVFACKYAEYICRDARFNFDQHTMPYFRRRMVYEILKMKLF